MQLRIKKCVCHDAAVKITRRELQFNGWAQALKHRAALPPNVLVAAAKLYAIITVCMHNPPQNYMKSSLSLRSIHHHRHNSIPHHNFKTPKAAHTLTTVSPMPISLCQRHLQGTENPSRGGWEILDEVHMPQIVPRENETSAGL